MGLLVPHGGLCHLSADGLEGPGYPLRSSAKVTGAKRRSHSDPGVLSPPSPCPLSPEPCHRLHCYLCRVCPPLHGPGIGSRLTAPHLRPWRSGDMVVASWLGPPSWPPPSPRHVPPGAGTSVSGLLTGPRAPPSRREGGPAVCPPVTPLSSAGAGRGVGRPAHHPGPAGTTAVTATWCGMRARCTTATRWRSSAGSRACPAAATRSRAAWMPSSTSGRAPTPTAPSRRVWRSCSWGECLPPCGALPRWALPAEAQRRRLLPTGA